MLWLLLSRSSVVWPTSVWLTVLAVQRLGLTGTVPTGGCSGVTGSREPATGRIGPESGPLAGYSETSTSRLPPSSPTPTIVSQAAVRHKM